MTDLAKSIVEEAQSSLDAGRNDDAIAGCLRALEIDPDCLAAHVCMAHAKLPGEDYLAYLRHFHEALRPKTYLEIGVDAGRTLSLARPPTVAVGVDPVQSDAHDFAAPTKRFAIESDVFFAEHDVLAEFGYAPIELAFIDGLHLFEQALKDFIHVERHAARDSVILFHDCLALDRATSSRTRQTGFWTGDVWKIVPILQRFRPDLIVFAIPTYPTGLCAVTRLDPASRLLERRFEEIVAEFMPQEWGGAPRPIVPNDWPSVFSRIRPPA